MINIKKTIFISLAIMLFVSIFSVINTTKAFALRGEKAKIEVLANSSFTLINKEKEKLNFKNRYLSSSTMNIYSERVVIFDELRTIMEIDNSESFTYIPSKKGNAYISIDSLDINVVVESTNCDKIEISTDSGNGKIIVNGSSMNYDVNLSSKHSSTGINITGKSKSSLEIEDSEDGILVKGSNSRFNVELTDYTYENEKEYNFDIIPYADTVIIKNQGGKGAPKVTGAEKLKTKSYKKICNVKAKPIDDTSLVVSWNKVKKAKGYSVYRYDSGKKKYKKIKNISGKNMTIFVDKKLSKNKKYTYKIRANKDSKGKKALTKKGYYVSAIASSDTRGNVSGVKLNKNKVKAKKGKKVKVKATVSTASGKNVLSKKVRWFSTNKKIATVNKKGVIKMKKKGTCYVYAKSHNGRNSKKLKVKVTK